MERYVLPQREWPGELRFVLYQLATSKTKYMLKMAAIEQLTTADVDDHFVKPMRTALV